jgi:putative isomerase
MWAEIATRDQAAAMVRNCLDESTFNAPFGIRSLSKAEKMYALLKTGNPSCWLGPVWGITNYMVYDGLKKYGYEKEAAELAEKTIRMFGSDLEKTGVLHEYYHPETGEPMNNPGFQNWNLLSLLMEC